MSAAAKIRIGDFNEGLIGIAALLGEYTSRLGGRYNAIADKSQYVA